MKKYILGLFLIIFFQSKGLSLAFQGSVDGYLTPSTKSVAIGEAFSAKVFINSGSGKISGINLILNTDATKLKVKSVVMNNGAFGTVLAEKVAGNVVTFYGASFKPTSELPSGQIEVGTIIFEGVANGSVEIGLVGESSINGPSTSSDTGYEIKWQKWTYSVSTASTVTPTSVPTLTPTLVLTAVLTLVPTIIPTATPIILASSGDASQDGKTDLFDFAIWKNEYLKVVTTKKADFNLDTRVDLNDFNIWKSVFLMK